MKPGGNTAPSPFSTENAVNLIHVLAADFRIEVAQSQDMGVEEGSGEEVVHFLREDWEDLMEGKGGVLVMLLNDLLHRQAVHGNIAAETDVLLRQAVRCSQVLLAVG